MAFCGKQLWRLVLAVQVLLAATTTVLAQQEDQGPSTSTTVRRLRRAPLDIIHIAATTPSDESLLAPLVRGLKSEKSKKSGKSEKSFKSGKSEKSFKKSGKSETTAHVRAIDFEGFFDLSMSMSM